MKILLESWRGVPHSYAIVNQRQCLELLRIKGLRLKHRDLPLYDERWRVASGLFKPDEELAIAAIPGPGAEERFDSVLRIAYPYDLRASSNAPRTFVFATCEFHRQDEAAFSPPLPSSLFKGGVELITPSNWSKEGLVRTGARPDCVHVVPHGFDPDVFNPATDELRSSLRETLGWTGRFVMLNIGAMTANKGVDFLFRAFAPFARRHPEAMLVMKGMDSLYASKNMLAATLRRSLSEADAAFVAARMLYIGDALPDSDLAGLMRAADLYVAPYLAEGFNMPVLEASACGLPSVCTAGGPTGDFSAEDFSLRVESSVKPMPGHEENICLMPSLDSLTSLLEKAFTDETWRLAARPSAASYVAERFTWRKVVGRLLEVVLPDFSRERSGNG